MKILLVEPDYKNKYPPMGLMKISTYHKNKGDYIFFYKGIYDCDEIWDRIYITTLFTFDYTKVVKTIEYYKKKVRSSSDIYIGGILASLMTVDLKNDTGLDKIITGRITSSSILGYDDDINIDTLPLDYDILSDTKYNYPASKSYIAYTSRGCVNKCSFCAVPDLEGDLKITNNIANQITSIRDNYGDKKDLMLLDNNILGIPVPELKKIVTDLNNLGFKNSKTFLYPNVLENILNTYYRYLDHGKTTLPLLIKCKNYLNDFATGKTRRISQANKKSLTEIIEYLEDHYDFFEALEEKYDELQKILNVYQNKILYQRYVDFNQGLDAREFTEEKISILSKLPLKPCRIAFDNIIFKETYSNAIRMAYKYGIRYYSNYLLYNADFDKPEDLYNRLLVNIELAESLDIQLFSFPMKYAPIGEKNRNYIGPHWNRHYLRSIQAIINVTKGVVVKERDFFERAFGSDLNEFFEILAMPHDFIVYRNYYEEHGYTQQWKNSFTQLTNEDRILLLNELSQSKYASEKPAVNEVLKFYTQPYRFDKKTKTIY